MGQHKVKKELSQVREDFDTYGFSFEPGDFYPEIEQENDLAEEERAVLEAEDIESDGLKAEEETPQERRERSCRPS